MDVVLEIADTNRPPVLDVSHHSAAIGQSLQFVVKAADPDANTVLTYAAQGLPEGATLDAESGGFEWTPLPSQAREYVVALSVSDGTAVVSRTMVLRAAIDPEPPQVTLELTPSFPAIPGQQVVVHAAASSLADITTLAVTVGGQPVSLMPTAAQS